MRFNQKVQAGLLFCLYLSRAGRASVASVAEGMGLSLSFLEQVARILRMNGLVTSIRGPGGGYELVGDPTIPEIMLALGYDAMLTRHEITKLAFGQQEHRALAFFVTETQREISDMFNVSAGVLLRELNIKENAMFDRPSSSAETN